MITNFNASPKTKHPACCSFACCGNKFGRIDRSSYSRRRKSVTRIVKTRRYAKHADKMAWKRDVMEQILDTVTDIDNDVYVPAGMNDAFSDFILPDWDFMYGDEFTDGYVIGEA